MSKEKEKKIVLAVDLDEVVFGYLNGLRNFMKTQGLVAPIEEPSVFAMDKSGWFETIEEFFKVHGEAVDDGIYKKLKPFEGASENINDLRKSGYEINIVTSRFINKGQHNSVLTQTADALDKFKIPYSNIMFLSDKTRFIADSYIDDGPHNLIPLRDAGRHVIAYSWRYNADVEGIDRGNNWDEIREILRNRYGK